MTRERTDSVHVDHLTLAELCDLTTARNAVASHPGARSVRNVVGRIFDLASVVSETVPDSSRAVVVYAPGRIEVLGKHTDYAGGSSLTCAVNQAFLLVAAQTRETGLRISDLSGQGSEFLDYADPFASATASWLAYPASVVARFVRNLGTPEHGVCIAFSSSIPRASGMSSSSAFVVGMFLALSALSDLSRFPEYSANLKTPEDLADYLGSVENGYDYRGLSGEQGVGTRGGSQDHTAILYSEQGQLGHYGYRPLRRLGSVDMPRGVSFAIASSGVRASKAGNALGAYNNAVMLSEAGLCAWNEAMASDFRTVGDMICAPTFSIAKLRSILGGIPDPEHAKLVFDRIDQFTTETQEILPAAIEALRSGDYSALGVIVDRSQDLTDRLLRNQVDETRFLARSAREIGAIASSAFGAGFGGSVWAMVPTADSNRFLKNWLIAYGREHPTRIRFSRFFIDSTGPGAFVLGASARKLLLEPKL